MTSSFDVDVAELAALDVNFREFAKKAGPAANRAIRDSTNYLLALAESTVAVLTGDLRDSLKADSTGAGPNQARRVYATDPAALENEYGTSRQAPHPFLMIHHPAALAALEGGLAEQIAKLEL